MSRSVIRRTTAAFAVLAVLAVALPAGAAPVRRQAPVPVASIGFFDQVLTWLGSLWAVPSAPVKQPVRTKAATAGSTTPSTTVSSSFTDRGAAIDPWGGS